MTTLRTLSSALFTLILLVASIVPVQAATSTAEVAVQAGEVTIGAPATITFPATTTSDAEQVVTITPDEFFWISDLKAASTGYYATLSISDLTASGGKTISATNVKASVSGGVTKIAGTDATEVAVPTAAAAGFLALDSGAPLTILERDTDANGKVGKYGVRPTLQLTVPGYQTIGDYTATLTYTLIEN